MSGDNEFGLGVTVGVGVCVGVVGIGWLAARMNYGSVRSYLARNITGAIRQKVETAPADVRAVADGMQLLTHGGLWSFVNDNVTLPIVDGIGSAIRINPNPTD